MNDAYEEAIQDIELEGRNLDREEEILREESNAE